jgi:KUP system potassium uptake protein
VFGDIGTSPLYTFKTILGTAEAPSDAGTVLGALSLVLWTLLIIPTVKYVSFAMRVDNDGEGGILALMALLGVKKRRRPTIVAVGLFGAALIYGDGAITPAISVLSALEGFNMAAPALQPYVVPAAVVILLALFAIQSQGTAAIGHLFGPVMLLWFVTIALMGISGIVRHPAVFAALNPVYGLSYLFSNGATGFLVLGAVFLCVTGAEALYADMGHFGRGPIKLAWFAIVFPSLILNYAGQAALVLEGAPTDGNIFFRLCPEFLLLPLIVLAHGGDHHRQSIDHYRGFLDDTAGDPAWLAAKVADQADVIGGLRADLRWRRQLAAHDRDRRAHHRFWQIR